MQITTDARLHTKTWLINNFSKGAELKYTWSLMIVTSQLEWNLWRKLLRFPLRCGRGKKNPLNVLQSLFTFRVQLLHAAIWYSVYDCGIRKCVIFTALHNQSQSKSCDYILKTNITVFCRTSGALRLPCCHLVSFVCPEESGSGKFTCHHHLIHA